MKKSTKKSGYNPGPTPEQWVQFQKLNEETVVTSVRIPETLFLWAKGKDINLSAVLKDALEKMK